MSNGINAGSGSIYSFGPTVKMKDMIGAATGFTPIVQSAEQNAADFTKVAEWGKWIRCDIPWNVVQNGGPSSWDWVKVDRWINPALDTGHNVIACFTYSPDWARAGSEFAEGAPLGHYHNPPGSDYYDEWETFITNAVTRYGGPGKVRHWEIWNEPNLSYFWKAGPNISIYVELLKRAYDAIKAVDPDALVLTGGLAIGRSPDEWDSQREYQNGLSGVIYDFFRSVAAKYDGRYFSSKTNRNVGNRPLPGGVIDTANWVEGASREPDVFLRELYEELDTNHGGARPFDHVGFHCYPAWPLEKAATNVGLPKADGSPGSDFIANPIWNMFWNMTPRLRQVIVDKENAQRVKSVKIVNTEAGIPSFSQTISNGVSPSYFSEKNQMNVIMDMLHIWFGPWKAWTGPFMIYKLRETNSGGPDIHENNLGIYKSHLLGRDDEKLIIKKLKRESDKELVAAHNFLLREYTSRQFLGGVRVSAQVASNNVTAERKRYLLGVLHTRWTDPITPATPADETGFTAQQMWDALESDLDDTPVPLRHVRKDSADGGAVSFDTAFGTSFENSACAIDYDFDNSVSLRASMLSFKIDPTDWVNPTVAGKFVDWCESVPLDHPLYLCYWPKPEANFTTPEGRELWKAGFQICTGLARLANNPDIKIVLTFGVDMFDERTGNRPGLWNPGAVNYDIFALTGVNPYNELYRTNSGALEPNRDWIRVQALLQPGFERMRTDFGATKFGVHTIGCHDREVSYAPNNPAAKYNYTSTDPTAKADWLRNGVDWCFQNYNMEFFCYLDSNEPNSQGFSVFPEGWWLRSTAESTTTWKNLLLKYS